MATTSSTIRRGPADSHRAVVDRGEPMIFEVTKEYVGPGDDEGALGETATGPNYPRQYG